MIRTHRTHPFELAARASLALVLLAGTAAAGDELFLGSPNTVLQKGNPDTGGFAVIGACGGQIHSMCVDGNDLFIGTPAGTVYHFDGEQGFTDYSFSVANDATALALHGGNLLVGGTDSTVLRVDKTDGTLIATLSPGVPVEAMLVQGDDVYVGSSFGVVFRGNATSGGFGFFGTCGGPVNSMVIDGTCLILGTTSGTIYRVSLATQQLVGSFQVASDATAMALHRGDLLIAGSNTKVLRVQRVSGASRGTLDGTFDIQAMALHEESEPGSIYCYGIGCPCGNDDPSAGCSNSTLVGSLLSGAGSASVGADDLVLTVSQIAPNKLGRFYMGSAFVQTPFGDGFLCAGNGGYGIRRFPVTSSGANGSFSFGPGIVDYTHTHFSVPSHILAGSTWNFQVWYRDPSGPCGGTFNTTNSYSVTFLP